jgi:hypothetical protein
LQTILNQVIFEDVYGTPEIYSNNNKNQIRNVHDMNKKMEYYMINECKQQLEHYFILGYGCLGTINIYGNQRKMEFVPSCR